MGKRFNLDIDNDFFEQEDLYKYCASCGTQMEKNAKFCIECGHKEFYKTLREYKSEKSLYCIKCLSKLPDGKKVCACCGERKYATAKMAFYHHYNEEFYYKILDENKQLETDLANFDNESANYEGKIKELDKEISKLKSKINPYKKEYIELEEATEIKELSDTLDKMFNKSEDELSIDQIRKLANDYNKKLEKINKKLSSYDEDSLNAIESIDNFAKEIENIKKEIDLFDFKTELFKKVKGKKVVNYDIYDQDFTNAINIIKGYYTTKNNAYAKMAEYANDGDYRAILIMEQKRISDNLKDEYQYIKNNLEAFAILDINCSDRRKNAPVANDLAMGYLYNGKLIYNIARFLPNNKEKAAMFYRRVKESGYKEYHFDSDFDDLQREIKKVK